MSERVGDLRLQPSRGGGGTAGCAVPAKRHPHRRPGIGGEFAELRDAGGCLLLAGYHTGADLSPPRGSAPDAALFAKAGPASDVAGGAAAGAATGPEGDGSAHYGRAASTVENTGGTGTVTAIKRNKGGCPPARYADKRNVAGFVHLAAHFPRDLEGSRCRSHRLKS
jgi:hypothetical protein